ncbi:MAG: hypothetical protein EOO85_07770 [Pedobacter sp.]|nr:MAG: hypothetical protein EOO85_07770 [Pedobacter sp.]
MLIFLGIAFAVLGMMKTKHLPDQLVDYAVQLALYSVPGMADTDVDARKAYKALATDLLLTQPRKSWQKLIHCRSKSARKLISS